MSREEALMKLRSVLVFRREAIRAALQGDLSALQELHKDSGDLADLALDAGHGQVTAQRAETESRELVKIEQAIHRMNHGNFGGCEGCEKVIPLARLEALPYATLCIKCQVVLEESGFEDWSTYQLATYDDD